MSITFFDSWTRRLARDWSSRQRGPVVPSSTDTLVHIRAANRNLAAYDKVETHQVCVQAGWSYLGKQCATDSWRCCPDTTCTDGTDGVFGVDRIACG